MRFLLGPAFLFRELRRRRVFNTVAIYIVGAWVALQVADQAFPALDIPESAIRYVWLGAIFLFPLVLVFGWRYDVSRGGVRRTPKENAPPGTDTSLGRPDHGLIAGLSLVALAIISVMLFEISRVEPEKVVVVIPQEYSLAVMPFGVCASRAGDIALAGGLTAEVIAQLAQRDRLKVIGQSTVFNLGTATRSAKDLSELTKTQYVLTGTLCRDGMDLRLDAEISDADGFIIWRENFMEVANRFDQVVQPLSQQLADGIALELGDGVENGKGKAVNRFALEQLLIGREYRRQGEKEKARDAFDKALEHQASFDEAIWERVGIELATGSLETLGATSEKTWPMAERALKLALAEIEQGVPDFHAHSIAGQILHHFAWQKTAGHQFQEAEQHFRSALLLNPSASDVRAWLAINLNIQGVERSGEALEIMEEGWSYDPFNSASAKQLSKQLAGRGQYRRAMEVLNGFEALPGGKRPLYGTQLGIQTNYMRFDDKLSTLIEIVERDPAGADWEVISHLWWIVSQVAQMGLFESAEMLEEQVKRIPQPEDAESVIFARGRFLAEKFLKASGDEKELVKKRLAEINGKANEEILNAWGPRATDYARPLWYAGQKERAIELKELLHHTQQAAPWSERQYGSALFLAGMYLEVGRIEDAEKLLQETSRNLEDGFDAGIRHPDTLGALAMAYGMLGDDKKALKMLRMAVDYGYWALLLDMREPLAFERPWWKHLEKEPGFVLASNRMQSIVNQQSRNVEYLLNQYDLEALINSLLDTAVDRIQESANGPSE